MTFYLNILRTFIKNWVRADMNRMLTIKKQCHRSIMLNANLTKQWFEPEKLFHNFSHRSILCFCRGTRNHILFYSSPLNWWWSQLNDPTIQMLSARRVIGQPPQSESHQPVKWKEDSARNMMPCPRVSFKYRTTFSAASHCSSWGDCIHCYNMCTANVRSGLLAER